MKKKHKGLSKLEYTSRILLFLISAIYVVYIFPKTGKFKYEFQKGYPWKHSDLIAPHDFAINKSDNEINEEKDSILHNSLPIFEYNEKNINKNLMRFAEDFSKAIFPKLQEDSINKVKLKKKGYNHNITEIQKVYTKIQNDLALIYRAGIIESKEIFKVQFQNAEKLLIKQNNITEIRFLNDLYSLKEAYQLIMATSKNEIEAFSNDKVKEFYQQLNLNTYIEPNLTYNSTVSKKILDDKISNISYTRGMIQNGQRIISRGEVVDDDKFRILESLKREYEKSTDLVATKLYILIGQIIIILSAFIVLFLFIHNFRGEILEDLSKTGFILLFSLLIITIGSIVIQRNLINIYLVPFALMPLIIKTFYDTRLALFIHLINIFLLGFIAPNSFEFVFLQFVAGISAILSMSTLSNRGQIFKTVAVVILAYCIVYFGIALMQERSIEKIQWVSFIYFAGNGILLLSAYPLIYVFEKLFGFLSDVTLLELSDTNRPLLRKLALEAPGTFQHSMQVANLAEEAIYLIGGNPLLIRTGALYHDIGKLGTPMYFIENQLSGFNPHDKMEAEQSAEIIINHVNKGIELATKYKLPKQVIEFIKTHHGISKVQYFYKCYKSKYPDTKIDDNKFTYPGPKPFSKEMAVLMMADSIEAASRSLKQYTEETINNLVDNIINYQIGEHCFTNASITFKDITLLRRLFKEKVKNIYHSRIEYPK